MKLNVKFSESKEDFKAKFGEVYNLSDGGYERGYAAGYEKGYVEAVEASKDDRLSDRLNDTLETYSSEKALVVPGYAFYSSESLVSFDCPNVESVGQYSFAYCARLYNVNLPKATKIGLMAFRNSEKIVKIDLGAADYLEDRCIYYCKALTTLIIRTRSVCALASSSSLNGSGIHNQKGYIYVPAALVEQYKAENNWKTYASQIRAIEDYPEICGG